MHSTLEKASNDHKSIQRPDCKHTYRCIKKKPHVPVTIASEMLTPSRRSRLSLDNAQIHSCYGKSTSVSLSTNSYGTRRSCNGLVVGRAAMYKRGMTMPESKQLTQRAITIPEVPRGSTNVHMPTNNLSRRLVDVCTLEEITR